jgi:hypothetical protein
LKLQNKKDNNLEDHARVERVQLEQANFIIDLLHQKKIPEVNNDWSQEPFLTAREDAKKILKENKENKFAAFMQTLIDYKYPDTTAHTVNPEVDNNNIFIKQARTEEKELKTVPLNQENDEKISEVQPKKIGKNTENNNINNDIKNDSQEEVNTAQQQFPNQSQEASQGQENNQLVASQDQDNYQTVFVQDIFQHSEKEEKPVKSGNDEENIEHDQSENQQNVVNEQSNDPTQDILYKIEQHKITAILAYPAEKVTMLADSLWQYMTTLRKR